VASFGAFVELRQRGQIGWVHRDLADAGLAAFWAALEPLPQAKGRGGVGTLTVAGRELVVRPYRRGGALGSLLRDRYSGPARAKQELQTLLRLRDEGVPVVPPIAAVGKRSGAFWRLRLCTELVPGVLPLPAFLAACPERRRHAAEAVGAVVRLALAAGLRHPDLHPDNVLCGSSGDKVRCVLVDLDRSSVRPPLDERTRDDMLVRMQRYIVRHRGKLAAVPTRAETMRFLRGLGLDRAGRHAAFYRLREKLERSLARRRWLRRAPVSGDGRASDRRSS
jgi:3-deoxy-D-manno-octulosonic acid kinase